MTGKRHGYRVDYDVGFDDDGEIRGVVFEFASRCGMSADLSGPVNDRTINPVQWGSAAWSSASVIP